MHVWIHGRPGTGKTTAARFFLREMKHQHGIDGAYVNCWECRTLYAVVDMLVLRLRILGADKPETSFKMERLKRYIGGKPFLLVLDEIDQPSPKERSSIIYNLCSCGNIGLVCISYSRQSYFELDERVRSRLNPDHVSFDPYSGEEVFGILKERAECGLEAGVWSDEGLRAIAELSKGDLRLAIQALKNAAYWAQEEGLDRLTDKHIQEAMSKATQLEKLYVLEKLTVDHQLLFEPSPIRWTWS